MKSLPEFREGIFVFHPHPILRIFDTERETAMSKFLLVGLGNVGAEYAHTRHNIGFDVLDAFVIKHGGFFKLDRLAEVAEVKWKGKTFICLKPTTFMNLSGKAFKYWMDKEKISLDSVLIITDDLNLPFGTIRIRSKGSDGGHNGLKNTTQVLNTQEYARFRFGISDAFKKGKQVDYVLGNWDEDEKIKLPERLEMASEIIKSFGLAGLEITMTSFNGK